MRHWARNSGRGLLLRELSPLGFWRLSLLTGVVWGVWHAPLIVQGHNFPDAPFAGIVVMTGWTVVASPLFTYLTVRAKSVLAAALSGKWYSLSHRFFLSPAESHPTRLRREPPYIRI